MRNIMLVGGPSHPHHDTAPRVAQILAEVGFETQVFVDIEAGLKELIRQPSALLTVYCLRWSMSQSPKYEPLRSQWQFSLSEEGRSAIVSHHASGGGLLGLHTAIISFDTWPQWRAHLGVGWTWGHSHHPPYGPMQVEVTDPDHPVTAGVEGFACQDELYSDMWLAGDAQVLAHSSGDGKTPQPAVVVTDKNAGRTVYLAPGHEASVFDISAYRQLLKQSAAWCAR